MIHIIKGGTLEIKRFRFPLILRLKCPKCSNTIDKNFNGDDYLSYPRLGDFNLHCYCNECDHEWEVLCSLSITLNVERTKT